MAVSSIVASDLVPLKKRALFQGYANTFFAVGSGTGGALGGLLADTIGWRWAFLIQVPILVITWILVFVNAHYVMPGQSANKRESLKRIDYFGSLTLVISLGSLLLSLAYKNNEGYPWSSPWVWGWLIVFVVFAVGFVLVEAFVAREPVMPLRLLKERNAICVSINSFCLSFVAFSVLYFYPMVFEILRQQTAAQAGLHLLPNAIFLCIGSLFAGWWIRTTGHYYWLIVISATLPVISTIGMAFLGPDSGTLFSWVVIVPTGFGTSSLLTASLIALISAVDRSDMATGTGITYLWRYCGQVAGVALSGALLQSVLSTELSKRITGPGARATIDLIRTESTAIATLPPLLKAAAIASYQKALSSVFILNAGVAVLTLLACVGLHEYALPGSFAEEEEQRRRRIESGQSTPVRSGTATPQE